MKRLFAILCVFVNGLVFYACNKNNFSEESIPKNKLTITDNKVDAFSAQYKSGFMTMVYRAKETNSITESSLEFFNAEVGSSPLATINFSLDISEPAYKLIQHEKVINQANSLSKRLKPADVKAMSDLFEVFGEGIIADKSTNGFSPVIQSVAFHKAILNAMKRAGATQDCGCTPHPGYFVDKTFFLCQEDVSISPSLYANLLKNGGYKMNDKEKTLLQFLEQKANEKTIPSSEVFGFIEPKEFFLQRINNSVSRAASLKQARLEGKEAENGVAKSLLMDCLRGSDWGCCGNYSGCCWFAAVECYLHDAACSYSKCQPTWLCGPQCKPD